MGSITAKIGSGPAVVSRRESDFQYTTLERDSIRLLRFNREALLPDIECSLENVTQFNTDPRPYAALSYCWGDASVTRPIKLNGDTFYVTTNLWNCLSVLRTEDFADYYWVDAICINQQDNEEKSDAGCSDVEDILRC